MQANVRSSCLSEIKLSQFLEGQTILEQSAQHHLQECQACQQALDQLTKSVFLVPFHAVMCKKLRSPTFLEPAIRAGDIGAIDQLAIEEIVDTGGMGTVLRGFDTRLGRTIAVKVLMDQNSKSSYARFEAEVRSVAKLQNVHIVPVYSIGRTSDNRPYMVMPFIAGENLSKKLKDGPLPPRQAAEYIRQVAVGLSVAHQAGLIHRDIKPANVLIDDSDGLAKIIDFGLVREPTARGLTSVNVVCGTPEYMSCEQAQRPGQIEARSDIYSLGITLYECLTGTTPFRGQPLEVLEQHRNVEPVPPSKLNRLISKDLDTICLKAIAKDPARRFATAYDFEQDLACYLSGNPIRARPISRLEKNLNWCKRNRAISLTVTLLLLSLVGGTFVSTSLWLQSRQNALAATKLTKQLQLSRDRMRESVQKFQSRIFSDESLHWQMSQEFRKEMFHEVISYLHEFAVFSDQTVQEQQSIVQSYLEVAQSALQVGHYEQAEVAARRAESLIDSSGNVPDGRAQLYRCIVSKILLLALHGKRAHEKESDGQRWRNQLENIARQCLAAADEALRLKPGDFSVQLNRITALIAIEETGVVVENIVPRSVLHGEISLKLDDLLHRSQSEEERVLLFRTRAQMHLLSIADLDQSEHPALLKTFDANVTTLKEQLRTLQKPLVECNRMSGLFRYRLGQFEQRCGHLSTAIESLKQSQVEYLKAVSMHPQNRRWRLELISVQLQLAECMTVKTDFAAARDALNTAIINLSVLLETDPKNSPIRLTIIDTLIAFGEASVQIGEYRGAYRGFYTAAQDCRLLMMDSELETWAFDTRLWALVKSSEVLEKFESAEESRRFQEHLQAWLHYLRIDENFGPEVASRAAGLIESRTVRSRPPSPVQILALQP